MNNSALAYYKWSGLRDNITRQFKRTCQLSTLPHHDKTTHHDQTNGSLVILCKCLAQAGYLAKQTSISVNCACKLISTSISTWPLVTNWSYRSPFHLVISSSNTPQSITAPAHVRLNFEIGDNQTAQGMMGIPANRLRDIMSEVNIEIWKKFHGHFLSDPSQVGHSL